MDGAHTYDAIIENQSAIKETADSENAITQYVKIDVFTGLDMELVTAIAGGLNSAVQVSATSLANNDKKFKWIQDEIKDESYFSQVAFRQGEADPAYDVGDILKILDLFNISDFTNEGTVYPLRAYSSKEAVLDAYLKKPANYERLRPILKDILILHDYISSEAGSLHNKANSGKAGSLAFMSAPRKSQFLFIGTDGLNGKDSISRPVRGALYPILGAFRWMVVDDEATGKTKWRGSFEDVVDLWRSIGGELMLATQSTSDNNSKNPNAIGKDRNHWATLHSTVIRRQLTKPTK